MKHECNVARDLMPLALDGAASEESQTLLDEHLEECADCKAYFEGMKAALPIARETGVQEEKAFDEATRKLRRKRRFRLWRRLLIGIHDRRYRDGRRIVGMETADRCIGCADGL